MSRPRPHPHKHGKHGKRQASPEVSYKKPILVVLSVALVIGIVTGILAQRTRPTAVLYAQEVEVFRTHGCRCVFSWAASLREQGFRVRVYERESLDHIRTQVRTPESYRACHVGTYLGYFLEGHVSGGALAQITKERVPGLGLATESTVNRAPTVNIDEDEKSDVLIVRADGSAKRWYTAPKQPAEVLRGT